MISDEHYDLCRPILNDPTIEEEDKIDRLEDILRKDTLSLARPWRMLFSMPYGSIVTPLVASLPRPPCDTMSSANPPLLPGN